MQIQVCLAGSHGFPPWELPLSPLEPFRDIHVSQGNGPRAERVPRDGKRLAKGHTASECTASQNWSPPAQA